MSDQCTKRNKEIAEAKEKWEKSPEGVAYLAAEAKKAADAKAKADHDAAVAADKTKKEEFARNWEHANLADAKA